MKIWYFDVIFWVATVIIGLIFFKTESINWRLAYVVLWGIIGVFFYYPFVRIRFTSWVKSRKAGYQDGYPSDKEH